MASIPPESLATRTARSIGWRASANLASVVVLFGRAVVLARLLEVSTFGTYALAFAIVKLTAVLASFGLNSALLHRDRETADEGSAAAQHFTLTLLFTVAWATVLTMASLRVSDPQLRTALLVLTAATFGLQLAQTSKTVLVRRVQHGRLALIDFCSAVFSTIAAVILALRGEELWAMLATDLVLAFVTLLLLFGWRPVWKPRLAWSRASLRYFFRFGSRSVLANLLAAAFDRVPSMWTGLTLGTQALGFFSRGRTFASYPRRVVASAINLVAIGTFAELKGDAQRLSKAFRRVNSLLLWVGFFVTGLLAVVAPEFIVVALGERWMPMLLPFRILLLYALLDPVERSLANLLTAAGEPGRVACGRLLRLVVLLIGLQWLGTTFGIAGVAGAASISVVFDVILLLLWSRRHVNFSALSIAGPPAAACLLAVAAAIISQPVFSTDLGRGLLEGTAFSIVFFVFFVLLWGRRLKTQLADFSWAATWSSDDEDPP